MRIGLIFALVLIILLPRVAQAAIDDKVIEDLKAQLIALTARLEALEETKSESASIPVRTYAPAQTPVQAGTRTPSAASWTEGIKLKGDFRYRHESFDIEGRDNRHRQRIRARTEMSAHISDTIKVGFGLATGGDDPVSTNQTLGDGASSKDVVLDLAYVNWLTPVEGLSVRGGKFKNPFHRAGGNGLLWDSDLRPEGAGVSYQRGDMFANAMWLFIDEDASGDDAFLIATQFGINTEIADGKLLTGIGYYNFTDTKGRDVFFDGDPRGNLVNPDGTYLNGFELLEGFAEYSFVLEDTKVTLFADYVKNLDADDFDTGYAFGVNLKQNSWKLGWTYQDLEADAVLATFTDSDFIGGGTDGKGHILQVGYRINKQVGLAAKLFLNDRNLDFGTEEDFKRLQLDISFKY